MRRHGIFFVLAWLLMPLTATALDINQEHPLATDPELPQALGLVLVLPSGMSEARQALFRAELERGLAAQGRLAPNALAAKHTLRVNVPMWAEETRAMGGRSDALRLLDAVVELKTLPMGELKASQRFSVSDPRLLSDPDAALTQLAADIARTRITEVPPDALKKPEGPVVKTAKFIFGAVLLVGVVALQVITDNPGMAR
jgi:hypothetical protein